MGTFKLRTEFHIIWNKNSSRLAHGNDLNSRPIPAANIYDELECCNVELLGVVTTLHVFTNTLAVADRIKKVL